MATDEVVVEEIKFEQINRHIWAIMMHNCSIGSLQYRGQYGWNFIPNPAVIYDTWDVQLISNKLKELRDKDSACQGCKFDGDMMPHTCAGATTGMALG